MISNERPSPYGYRPRTRPSAQYGSYGTAGYPSAHGGQGGYNQGHSSPKPQVNEDTLRTEKIQIERKTFILTLKENPRGRFLRITEDVNGRRDNIIIPSTGLEEFRRLVDEMVKTANEIPDPQAPPDEELPPGQS
jgi:hypothetical protein